MEDSQAQPPEESALTVGELLDRSLGREGMHGVVFGTVLDSGAPKTISVGGAVLVVTDFLVQIQAELGAPMPLFSGVPVITVRVPGGRVGPVVVEADAPTVRAGQNLYVWVQDQPELGVAGPRSVSVVPVTTANNVAELEPSGTVNWSGDPLDRPFFESRLLSHPAPN